MIFKALHNNKIARSNFMEIMSIAISPTCDLPQGNDMVSSVGRCNDDSMLIVDDPSSLYYCNAPPLGFNTSSTPNVHMLVLIVLAYHVEIA